MNERKEPADDDCGTELQSEIRSHRKFSLDEAIARLGGGELMKGASPITQKRQAELQIESYLEKHLIDSEGAVEPVLLRRASASEILLKQRYERPLAALARVIEEILASEGQLQQLVDEIDAEWGRMYRERPYFERDGRPAHADDPYTLSSVRDKLAQLLDDLRGP